MKKICAYCGKNKKENHALIKKGKWFCCEKCFEEYEESKHSKKPEICKYC